MARLARDAEAASAFDQRSVPVNPDPTEADRNDLLQPSETSTDPTTSELIAADRYNLTLEKSASAGFHAKRELPEGSVATVGADSLPLLLLNGSTHNHRGANGLNG